MKYALIIIITYLNDSLKKPPLFEMGLQVDCSIVRCKWGGVVGEKREAVGNLQNRMA